jgi:NAD+ synthase
MRATEATPPADPGRDPLTINCELVAPILVGFVRSEVRRVGFARAVLGLSGGIDSTLSAYIAAEALGPENVCGVRMPYSTSSSETMDHGALVAERLGIRMMTVPIHEQVDAYFARFPDASRLRRANKMSRERMTILYDQSAAQDALVVGTSNKTELLIGYGTIFGDMASALNPIGDLYKTQVRALSAHLGVPEAIIAKHPTADLWVGQTDETELGFTYAEVDRLLARMVDERARPDELIADGFDPAFILRIHRMIQTSHYKRRLPLIAKVSLRTIARDFLYARDWGT